MSEYKITLEFCKLLIDLSKAKGNNTLLLKTRIALEYYIKKYNIDNPTILKGLEKIAKQVEHIHAHDIERKSKKKV